MCSSAWESVRNGSGHRNATSLHVYTHRSNQTVLCRTGLFNVRFGNYYFFGIFLGVFGGLLPRLLGAIRVCVNVIGRLFEFLIWMFECDLQM